MERNKGQRIDGLDVIKAVGIMMVLSLHVPLWDPYFMETYDVSHIVQYACRIVISEGVPLFMAVNGFLLLKKEELDIKRHIKKIVKCLSLLCLWCIILAVSGLILQPGENVLNIKSIVYFVLNTQLGSAYTGVLWFIQFLIAVYFIYPVLWYLYKNNFHLYQYLFLIVAFFSLGPATLTQIVHLLSTRFDVRFLDMFISFIDRLNPIGNIWYTFYFMLGGMLWKHIDFLKKKRCLLSIVGILAWVFAVFYGMLISKLSGSTYDPAYGFNCISMVLLIIGLFAFVLPYKQKEKIVEKIVLNIGQNTFGIYLTHYLFIFIVQHYWNYNAMNSFRYRFLAYIIIFTGSYMAAIVIKRVPYLKRITEL